MGVDIHEWRAQQDKSDWNPAAAYGGHAPFNAVWLKAKWQKYATARRKASARVAFEERWHLNGR